ncbi:hypothetical protein V8E36_000684 [Tilletia maclaganii]
MRRSYQPVTHCPGQDSAIHMQPPCRCHDLLFPSCPSSLFHWSPLPPSVSLSLLFTAPATTTTVSDASTLSAQSHSATMLAFSRLLLLAVFCVSSAQAATQRVTTTKCTTTSNILGYQTTTIRASPTTRTVSQTIRPIATSTSTVTAQPCIKTTVKAIARSTTVTAAAATKAITVTSTSFVVSIPTTTKIAPTFTPTWTEFEVTTSTTYTTLTTTYRDSWAQPTLAEPPQPDGRRSWAEKRHYEGKKVVCRPTVKVISERTLKPTSTVTVRTTFRPTITSTQTVTAFATFTAVPTSRPVVTKVDTSTLTAATVTSTSTPTADPTQSTSTVTATATQGVIANYYIGCDPLKVNREYTNNVVARAGQLTRPVTGTFTSEPACCDAASQEVGAIGYAYAAALSTCVAMVLEDSTQCIRTQDPTYLYTEFLDPDVSPIYSQGLLQCASDYYD